MSKCNRRPTLFVCVLLLLPCMASAQLTVKTIYDYSVGRNPKRVLRIDPSTNKFMLAPTGEVIIDPNFLSLTERDKKDEIVTCIDKDGRVTIKNLPRWFPTRANPESAKCLFFESKPALLKSTEFLGTTKAVTVTNEILSDVFYGVRFGFSTAVTAPREDQNQPSSSGTSLAEENAVEQNLNLLAANGGNLAIAANYPIYFRGFQHPLDPDRKTGYLLSNFLVRTAATVGKFEPAQGSSTATIYDWGEVNGNAELGIESRALFSSEQDVFGFLAYTKASLVAGTEAFSKSIGSKDRNPFVHLRAAIGARLGGLVTIGLGWTWYSDNDIPGRGGSLLLGFSK